ncbi:ABC transporter ATP-binding protein [Sinomonas albida]|uniref:ABC transporter ATP-binding protein n=1 Tax=Sinomonas albida TaxID=369942 RepID=UPI0010A7F672|nr:ABC transporter ATP-binding protein [Sinomonas albida]
MSHAAARRADGAELDGGRPAAVELRRVSVRYPGAPAGVQPALADLSLRIEAGETVALLGPSGSGKSTALKAIAGFEQPSEGTVLLAGRDVTGRPPAERGLGVVVQQYALFPHLRVADNVAYGLRARRLPRAQVRARVAEMLEMVGMESHARKLPRELSGGQQQRIAIARALAIRPDVLLLDEPLSALDARMRQDMLEELVRLRGELPDVAMVFVTHDQSEALALADRIGVMRDGRLVDLGTADELYHHPRHAFTASFLGGSNLLDGVIEPLGSVFESGFEGAAPVSSQAVSSQTGSSQTGSSQTGPAQTGLGRGGASPTFRVRLDAGGSVGARVADPGFEASSTGGAITVAVRPHALRLLPPNGADRAVGLRGIVQSVQWRGAGHRLRVALGRSGRDAGCSVVVDLEPFAAVPEVGDSITIGIVPGEAVIVPRDTTIGGLRAVAGPASAGATA